MKFRDPKNWGALIGAGVIATLAVLPEAHAELIYDDQVQQQPAPAQVAAPVAIAPAGRVEERETLRQVIQTSQKAEQAVQPVQSAVVAPPVTAEVQNLSKSELLRRERMREEMKNEDVLQERLEALRLKDEQKRSDQLLALPATNAVAPAATAPMQVKEEVLSQGMAATQAPIVVASAAPVKSDQIVVSQSSATSAAEVGNPDSKTEIVFTPRGGLSTMSANGQFNIQSRFTAGLGFAVTASEHMAFEVGYAYSEYGAGNNSQYAANYVQPGLPNNSFENLVMKQNVFDMGLKFFVLGPESKLRPFIGGGGAYSKTFINYDQRIVDFYNSAGNQAMTQDVTLSSYLGYVSTGIDVRISKSISVGAMFKYYQVLSARASSNQNTTGYGGYGYAPVAYSPDVDKQQLGSAVTNQGFSQITAGASFAF